MMKRCEQMNSKTLSVKQESCVNVPFCDFFMRHDYWLKLFVMIALSYKCVS